MSINNIIDTYVVLHSEEEERIHETLSRLQNEKEKLEKEKDSLQKKNEASESELRSQLKEVCFLLSLFTYSSIYNFLIRWKVV